MRVSPARSPRSLNGKTGAHAFPVARSIIAIRRLCRLPRRDNWTSFHTFTTSEAFQLQCSQVRGARAQNEAKDLMLKPKQQAFLYAYSQTGSLNAAERAAKVARRSHYY
jgi:hypothetical protein